MAVYTPAVIAFVTDSVTGQPLGQTALGVIQAGTILDSLHFFGPTPDEMAAGSQSGTYVVRVEHPGYGIWTRSNVQVTPSGVCSGVNTVSLHVKLVPAP